MWWRGDAKDSGANPAGDGAVNRATDPVNCAESARLNVWNNECLRSSLQIFKGTAKPTVDTSANRGSGWLGRR